MTAYDELPALVRNEARSLEVMSGMDLFAGVPARKLRALAPLVGVQTRSAGSVLVQEGVTAREVIVLASGFATGRKAGAELGVAGPGELLGDPAELRRRTSTVTWTADTEVQVLTALPEDVRELYSIAPEVYTRLTGTHEEAAELEAQQESSIDWAVGLVAMFAFLVLATVAFVAVGDVSTFR